MSIFNFKQFSVNQSGCAMKVNTDGVLLGALAQNNSPGRILDIGTGTGVIALMLAQRYYNATIDAVEIAPDAAFTAGENFKNSVFSSRLKAYTSSFQHYFTDIEDKYDLIVSNPPFFINSLKNPGGQKHIARHTNEDFFKELIYLSANTLNQNGNLTLIIPAEIFSLIVSLTESAGLYLHTRVGIKSFPHVPEHRYIVSFGFRKQEAQILAFTIYERQKEYSSQYITALKDFFTIF